MFEPNDGITGEDDLVGITGEDDLLGGDDNLVVGISCFSSGLGRRKNVIGSPRIFSRGDDFFLGDVIFFSILYIYIYTFNYI
jgi:hypothetical protein